MAGHLISVLFILSACHFYEGKGLRCGACDDVIKPAACDVNATCGVDQICGVNQYMSFTNEFRYKLRCMPKMLCSVLLNSPSGNICAQCCNTDLCNTKVCNNETTSTIPPITTHLTNRPTTTIITQQPRHSTVPSTTSPIPTIPTTIGSPVLLPQAATSKSVIRLNGNNTSDKFTCTAKNSDMLFIYVDSQNRLQLHKKNLTTISHEWIVKEWKNSTIRCKAVNSRTNKADKADVTVIATGVKPYFPVSGNTIIEAREGDHVGLACIPEGDPKPVVTWHVPNQVSRNSALRRHISYHFDRVELEISNMTSSLAGTYNCTAHNPLGDAVFSYTIRYIQASAQTTTTVTPTTLAFSIKPEIFLQKQITVMEGTSTLAIPCAADGIPAPSIKWATLEGYMSSNIQQYKNYLIIHNIDFFDSRYYICEATNSAGTVKQAVHLIVKSKPHVAPSINLKTNLQVKYGSRVVLHCDVTGYPEPNITWSFNGVVKNHSKDLVLNQATMADIGAYSCVAVNDAGSASKTVVMLVTGTPPSVVTSQPTTITVSTDKPVVLKCTASGEPAPEIRWMFKAFIPNASPVTQSVSSDKTTLTLSHISSPGTATCVASNPFGQVQASFSVIYVPQTLVGRSIQ